MNLSVLPASCRQGKPICRRDVGSTLLGRTSRFTLVHGSDARPILEAEAFHELSNLPPGFGLR